MLKFSINKKLHSASGKMNLQIDLSLEKGSFTTLYGKSGSGKTSTLRILAGLLKPDEGQIELNGNVWLDTKNKINRPPQKRKVGLVFQDYSLFPNMTVEGNLMFALDKNQDRKPVDELIEMMELGAMRARKPTTLSGGQQQRVALARALVQKPDLLLLDEPLSALDNEMRWKLQEFILRVHQEYQLTTLLVSHDIPEIMKLSDKVVVIENGEKIKEGNPFDLLAQNNGSDIQLTGQLLSKTKKDTFVETLIQIGNNTIPFSFNEREVEQLKVGDNIKISLHAHTSRIQKT